MTMAFTLLWLTGWVFMLVLTVLSR